MNKELIKAASRSLCRLTDIQINKVLLSVADSAEEHIDFLLEANRRDLQRMDVGNALYDRLQLTPERIHAIAHDMRAVAALPSPLGRVLKQRVLPNGLRVQRVSVPFGVIGIVYEARPNVTFDTFSLCLKAGSACVLKGGRDADETNRAIVTLIHSALEREGVTAHALTLLPATHEATAELLTARDTVDLVIPRGSKRLIDFVRREATVPVIETGAGVCHTYIDRAADLDMAARIILNGKTRRVSVCNALDCTLLHADLLPSLPRLMAPLAEKGVTLYADDACREALRGHYPEPLLLAATEEHYGTEFLSLRMALRAVASLDEALLHIRRYGSGHSEAIVTDDSEAARTFLLEVDAACVYHNAPTAFTDGAQFGLGAEIGISTQKLHARGPMALEEITTYKWIIEGEGQTRA